jgi:Ran GTPase-activating protein (RanGAP) involved in mRNA processing and transport
LKSGKLFSLSGLVLARCYLGHGVVPITQAMEAGKVPNLEVLDLSSNIVGDRGSMALARALRSGKLSKLQKLSISECGIPPSGLELIAEAMEVGHVWGLRYLDMSNNYDNSFLSRDVELRDKRLENYGHVKRDMGSFALAKLMRSGGLQGLQYLNLSRVSMTDDGLMYIAEEMEAGRVRNLERFLLTDNDIGSDRSVKSLAKAIQSPYLSKLQELDLGHNVDGEDLTKALVSSLEDSHSELESPLVRKLKEGKEMFKSPIARYFHNLLLAVEPQVGFSLKYVPNPSNLLSRYWQGQTHRSVSTNDEDIVETKINDNKMLFNVLLVIVWIVAVWVSKW